MPNITTSSQPGSMTTTTDAGPGPGGPSDLENFYRELLKRQSMQAMQAQRPQPAPRQAAPQYQQPVFQPPPQVGQASAESEAERQDRQQELAYRQRLREIDLNPPKKYIESRPGINGGYIADTSLLPVSMRPKEAHVAYGPQDESRERERLANEGMFQQGLANDRARTRF